MRFKNEFRYRLVRLRDCIDCCLSEDELGSLSECSNLFPYLASIYVYIWSHKSKVYKK